MISSTEPMITEESNQNYSSEIFSSTMSYFSEVTTTEQEINPTESEFVYMTTNEANNEEETNFTSLSTNVNEEESSTVSVSSIQPRLFHLLADLSQYITTENPFNDFNSTVMENDTISTG
jgi:hypothetical protein